MAANKRPRKKYTPRAARACTPLEIATHRAGLLSAADRAQLIAKSGAAFDDLRASKNARAAWGELADVLNISEALCERGIAWNLGEMIQAGHDALAAQFVRAQAGKGWALYAAEIKAVDDALWVYRTQLEHCSAGEAMDAATSVRRRMSQALAGNAGAGVTVHSAIPA